MKKTLGSIVLLVMLITALTALRSRPESVTGTWSGSWRDGAITGALVFRLTQDGETVQGTYDSTEGRRGSLRAVRVQGTLKGDHLTLKTLDEQRAFDGTVQGRTISGTYSGKYANKGFGVRKTEK